MTYNPFGIKENKFKYFYKHIFPSGIGNKLEMRHKADNSVFLLLHEPRLLPTNFEEIRSRRQSGHIELLCRFAAENGLT
jgi:hypothetical protein